MNQLTIYFDGACHLCSREINHYRKKDHQQQIRFVDISRSNFVATQEHLDPIEVQRVMHVRLPNGQLRTGVDAFVAIWQTLPGYGGFAKAAQNPIAYRLLNIGYAGFAKVRPLLPKRKVDDCETGACHV